MSAGTLTEDDTLVIEFLEFGIPCERGSSHDADVVVTCRFCPHSGYLCHRHATHLRLEAELKLEQSPVGMICCAFCLTMASSFDDLFTVVKI